ncbi:MAG: two-component sensor histidine kinase [Micrococcales bacterium 73-13]|nr:MAG: two-component sensor histidine kinase [Micrococcales bacterium 73-13]
MPRWVDPRLWWRSLVRAWRTSLALRTISMTIVLSAIAAAAVGVTIELSISQSLLDARRTQLVTLSQSATISAQRSFDASVDQGDVEPDAALYEGVRVILSAAATTSDSTSYALVLAPGQDVPGSSAQSNSRSLDGILDQVVSTELRDALAADAEGRVYSQSTGLPRADGSLAPAIVTGSMLEIQGVRYQLFLVYDISDTEQTLSTIQFALAGAGLALIALIGAVTFLVVRLVVGPVQVAAATSRRLAAGELDVRLPVRGDDVLATLARSFNGMAESLRGQITRLAELSTVQQRFVSDVSHELRTPLTTIRLAGDVLRDRSTAFDPDTARTVELLHTQILRFEQLLGDLLEMSRFDAGAVEMEYDRVNVARLAEDTVASMTPLAEQRGSELVLVAEGGHFEAEVDARRIRRIISNLIGNAIDHGESRPIEVWVDSDANAAAIAVRDYGVGIAVEHLDRVFDRFWRGDPSRQRTTGGTGLGLAISLEDAALHGGWLEAWSAPGQGSCFRLTIPRARGMALRSSPLPLPPEAPPEALDTGVASSGERR